MNAATLVVPSEFYLRGYVEALERGWSPNTLRPEASREQLEKIEENAAAFLASLDDREARGEPVTQPDGTKAPRIPGFNRWIWDGEFCGSVGFRWQKGTVALPPHVLGHIGYTIVPWKQGRGYAKRGLALLLEEVRDIGLPYAELTTDPANIASQRVILANGGALVERFCKSPAYGGAEALRFRIPLKP
jgi:predicted acetyltransferase